jgi:hypothetical protein
VRAAPAPRGAIGAGTPPAPCVGRRGTCPVRTVASQYFLTRTDAIQVNLSQNGRQKGRNGRRTGNTAVSWRWLGARSEPNSDASLRGDTCFTPSSSDILGWMRCLSSVLIRSLRSWFSCLRSASSACKVPACSAVPGSGGGSLGPACPCPCPSLAGCSAAVWSSCAHAVPGPAKPRQCADGQLSVPSCAALNPVPSWPRRAHIAQLRQHPTPNASDHQPRARAHL